MLHERGEQTMQEEQFSHVTMVAPAPGFTQRVMARLEERERTAERRRAVIGIGILIAVATAVFAGVGAIIISVVMELVSFPDLPISALVALIPFMDVVGTLLGALWTAATVLVDVIGPQILLYAVFVLAMTLIWVRVVNGSFQLTPHTLGVGGSK